MDLNTPTKVIYRIIIERGGMRSVMHFLFTKEKKFFGMLAEQSEAALDSSKELMNFVDEFEKRERSDRKQKLQSIASLKKKNIELTSNIMMELSKSYRTPIDKEDIGQLAVLIGDITNLTDSVASSLVILGIERIDSHTPKMVALVHRYLNEINRIIKELDKLKRMEEHYSFIYNIKNEADQVYEQAISDLFHFYKNSMDVIKYKEIYALLEKTIEKCSDVSYVISKIFAKHK